MITRIEIDGFKSFKDFEMTFTPLTVVAGANASGKSNLFDALKLLARLAETDLRTAFSEQRGGPNEQFTQYGEELYASKMQFTVEMLVSRKITDNWGGKAELSNARLRYKLIIANELNQYGVDELVLEEEQLEEIGYGDDNWLKAVQSDETKGHLHTQQTTELNQPFIETVEQDGITTIQIRGGREALSRAARQTMLSGVNSVNAPQIFAAKEEMRSWMFLQLNPADLREPTRQDAGLQDTITSSGKNLGAALFRIKQTDEYNLKDISRRLNSFLPNFTEVNVYDDKANRQFIIKLRGEDGKEFSSRILSEGTLRLLALSILEFDDLHTSLLCFEEPENGIHPARIKAMAALLKDLSTDFTDPEAPLRQVIVNTHSPALVSHLIQWRDNRNVSIWLSRLHTLIFSTDTNAKAKSKVKLKITKMSPVAKDEYSQSSLVAIPEAERKYTLNEVIEYLEAVDTEDALRAMQ